jgi:hypothetical protein
VGRAYFLLCERVTAFATVPRLVRAALAVAFPGAFRAGATAARDLAAAGRLAGRLLSAGWRVAEALRDSEAGARWTSVKRVWSPIVW